MQAPTRVIAARIERHLFGRELVIAFEAGDDMMETRFERVNFAVLDQRAEELGNCWQGRGGRRLTSSPALPESEPQKRRRNRAHNPPRMP
jgi:hypothetical protein